MGNVLGGGVTHETLCVCGHARWAHETFHGELSERGCNAKHADGSACKKFIPGIPLSEQAAMLQQENVALRERIAELEGVRDTKRLPGVNEPVVGLTMTSIDDENVLVNPPVIGKLRDSFVVIYYDGPRLFTARDEKGRIWAALEIDGSDEYRWHRWMYGRSTEAIVAKAMGGKIDSREVWTTADLVYEITYVEHGAHAVRLSPLCIGDERLPEPTSRWFGPQDNPPTNVPYELKPGSEDTLTFRYRNHRGEIAERRVQPIRLWYGATEHHPYCTWLLKALDVDRGAERDFALHEILTWTGMLASAVLEQSAPSAPAAAADDGALRSGNRHAPTCPYHSREAAKGNANADCNCDERYDDGARKGAG